MHCAQSARSLALLAIIPIAGLAELETTANVTSCGGVGGGEREWRACPGCEVGAGDCFHH